MVTEQRYFTIYEAEIRRRPESTYCHMLALITKRSKLYYFIWVETKEFFSDQ